MYGYPGSGFLCMGNSIMHFVSACNDPIKILSPDFLFFVLKKLFKITVAGNDIMLCVQGNDSQ